MAFIIPSRWFAGGKGLDAFRDEMLHDRRIGRLVDYPNAEDCFPGVEIAGGVCYFIWDRHHDGQCKITTVMGDTESNMCRNLDEFETFIRWNDGVSILRKVRLRNESTLDEVASARKPFGLATNFTDFDAVQNPDKYKIYASTQTGQRKTGFVLKTKVQKGIDFIDKWKVLLPKAYRIGSSTDGGTIRPIVAEPNSVCTETFIVIKAFDSEEQANNFVSYVFTRLFRFLVMLRKLTQDATAKVYSFVPDLPMDREWTDEKLFERYNITPEEQDYIKSRIKEM